MYDQTWIIYNPVSTSGQAAIKAKHLAERLRRRNLKNIHTIPTERPGHAEELAYQAGLNSPKPLIISVSGDGGYSEVVNGLMRAKNTQATCAILPAGNANDHRRSTRKRPLTWAITHAQPEAMDLLQLTAKTAGGDIVRYAHSYIGVGLTSHIAADLYREQLSPLKEVAVVAKAILSFHPIAVHDEDGKTRRYNSLIFSNIHHMAKFMRLGTKADINNGSFRVAALPYRAQFWLLRIILNILLFAFGLQKLPQQTQYGFSLAQAAPVQIDGEVLKLPANTHVTISMAPAVLQTIR